MTLHLKVGLVGRTKSTTKNKGLAEPSVLQMVRMCFITQKEAQDNSSDSFINLHLSHLNIEL